MAADSRSSKELPPGSELGGEFPREGLLELDPQQAGGAVTLRAVTRRILSFRSDTLIASIAVIGFCFFLSFLLFVLSWLAYNERYGIGFWDFVKMAY